MDEKKLLERAGEILAWLDDEGRKQPASAELKLQERQAYATQALACVQLARELRASRA